MLKGTMGKLIGILGKNANGTSTSGLYDYREMTNLTMAVNVSILSSYIMNAYRFKGLPEEIDENLVWAILTQFSCGVMFYNHDADKFMFLPFVRTETDNNNFLFKPTLVEARDFNGKTYSVRCDGAPEDESEYWGSVIYISNTSRFNLDLQQTLYFYATKMTSIDRSIDVRRNYHRAPVLFTGDEKMRSTFEKVFTGITEFKPFFALTEMFQEGLNSITMDFEYINDKLFAEKQQYQNEFLNLWGINNNNSENKRERLITDEVNANNEQLLINRDNVLNSINDFAKDWNMKFDAEVEGYFVRDYVSEEVEDIGINIEDIIEKGGEE